MTSYDPNDDDAAAIVAATFIDRESAHHALTDLHRAGFRKVWLGVTRLDTPDGERPTLENENAGGFMETLGRFFSGEAPGGHALHEALVTHGLSEAQARRIDETISPGDAVVLVDGEYDPPQAMRILKASGGELESNGASVSATTNARPARTAPAGSDENANDSDSRRLDLHEERLSIDKERVYGGEARIGKDVIAQEQSVDVPVFHEELYIERRPVRGSRPEPTATPIGESEEIRVPLAAERVDVSKHTIVTEEVAIGKRRVEGTERVTETVRHEELHVDDPPSQTSRVRDDAPLGDR